MLCMRINVITETNLGEVGYDVHLERYILFRGTSYPTSPILKIIKMNKRQYDECVLCVFQCYRSHSLDCSSCSDTSEFIFIPPTGTFSCWFDPGNGQALENKLFNSMSVFHVLFWPLLSIASGLMCRCVDSEPQ